MNEARRSRRTCVSRRACCAQRRWLRDKRTMLDSGVVLKQLERYCSSHCKQLLQLARRDGRN